MRWYTPTSIWLLGAGVGGAIAALTGELAALPASVAAAAAFTIRLELGS